MATLLAQPQHAHRASRLHSAVGASRKAVGSLHEETALADGLCAVTSADQLTHCRRQLNHPGRTFRLRNHELRRLRMTCEEQTLTLS